MSPEIELRQKIEEHRSEQYFTCPDDCWCWSAESLLTTVAQAKIEMVKLITLWEAYLK